VAPTGVEGLDGLTWIEARLGATFKITDPFPLPRAAPIVVLPVATPVTTPVPLTIAAAGFDELQAAELVRS
jgi:hypothetical protein